MSRFSFRHREYYGVSNTVCGRIGLHFSDNLSPVNDSMQQVNQLEKEKRQLERTLQEQNRSLRYIRERVEQLERALQERNTSYQDIKQQVYRLEGEKRQLDKALQERDKSVEENMRQSYQFENEKRQLERELQERNKSVEYRTREVCQLENRMIQLKLELEERDQRVLDSMEKIHQLEREQNNGKRALQEQNKSLIKIQQQLSKLERENKELKLSEKDLQNRLDREKRKRNMFNSLDRLEFISEYMDSERISLQHILRSKDELQATRKTMSSLLSDKTNLTDKQTTLNIDQRSCRNYINEISDLKAEDNRCKHNEESLNKSEKDACHLQEEIIHLKSDNSSYQKDIERLKNQTTELKREIRLLEEEIRQRPSDIDHASCQSCRKYINKISDLLERFKHKEELLEKSEKNNSQLKENIDQLTSANVSYQHEKEKYYNQATQLKREIQLLEEKQRLQQISKSKDDELHTHEKKMSNLLSDNKDLINKCKHKDELLEKAEKNTRQLQEEIIKLKYSNSSYQNDIEKLSNQTTQMKREIQLLEEKIRLSKASSDLLPDPRNCQQCWRYTNEISDLKIELSQMRDRCKRTEDLLETSERNTRQSQEEIVHLKSDNLRYKNDNDKLQSQATQLKKDIQMLEENIRQKPSDILPDPQQSCQNCRNYRNEISDLKASVISCKHTAELLENSEKKTRQLQDEINDLKSDNVSYQKDIEELKNQKLQLKNEIQLLEGKLSRASSDLLLDSRNCQHCWIYRNEISDLKVEVNKLRDRLSEAAGNKLRDGNPNIADLSDFNRPTSLAEKFGSLYTDEYTDAMEVIEGTMDEQASVLFLLQLLQRCYDWSKKLAEEQRHLLSVESFGFMKKYLKQPSDFQLPDSCLIYIKEFQKKISADGNNLGAVEMICIEDGMKQVDLKSNQNIKKYMKKCSLLCWMMQISDPPIYLNFDVKVGEKLDKNVYNVFTKSGSQIEFLVWPAMYIHRTGPMLAKGVAQGK